MFTRTFSSLKYRNYRLFFFGQLISLIGTWMQWTAQSWLVYKISNSKVLLGIIAACGSIPMLLLAIIGGMAADRFSKRKILLCTQTVMMISAFVLGLLVTLDVVRVWHIALLAVVSGIAAAFDMPTRQAFVNEMIEGDDLMNAIGLNSSIFNAARIVGPAVAGLIMAELTIGLCFILNSISFLAVIIGLLMMKFKVEHISKLRMSMLNEIKEGFSYALKRKDLFWIFFSVAIFGIFGWSYAVMIPAFARDVLAVTEKGYGFMLTAGGVGALFAALSVATIGKLTYSKLMLIGGMIIFSLAVVVFAYSQNYYLSLAMLLVAAYGITGFFATANSYVQGSVENNMRGRVMGIWSFVFGGMMPLGSLQIGFVGEKLGPQFAVTLGAIICFFTVIFLGYNLYKNEPKKIST